jgi:hypothetical protein
MKLKLRSKANGEILPLEAFDLLIDGADLIAGAGDGDTSALLPVLLLAMGGKPLANPRPPSATCACYGQGDAHASDCVAWRNGLAREEGAKLCRHGTKWEACPGLSLGPGVRCA